MAYITYAVDDLEEDAGRVVYAPGQLVEKAQDSFGEYVVQVVRAEQILQDLQRLLVDLFRLFVPRNGPKQALDSLLSKSAKSVEFLLTSACNRAGCRGSGRAWPSRSCSVRRRSRSNRDSSCTDRAPGSDISDSSPDSQRSPRLLPWSVEPVLETANSEIVRIFRARSLETCRQVVVLLRLTWYVMSLLLVGP